MTKKSSEDLTSLNPHLFTAFLNWIAENNLTPYIGVDVKPKYVLVPMKFVENNKIILNISADAVRQFKLSNDIVEFDTSFQGETFHIFLPFWAISAIYAKENGVGTVFPEEERSQLEKKYCEKLERKDTSPLKIIETKLDIAQSIEANEAPRKKIKLEVLDGIHD